MSRPVRRSRDATDGVTSVRPVRSGPDQGPRRTLLLRMLPPGTYAGRALVLMERSVLVYRRAWVIIVTGFVEPLLYLLSFGTGLGVLVGHVQGPGGVAVRYAEFIAPALLASSAMNGAVFDSTMNVFYKLKFAKLYDGMLATSLGPFDVALGEIGWALSRGGLYAIGFVLVMLVMGLISSWWALLLVPAAVLVAFGFGSVGMAVTTYFRNWQDLEVVNLIILPMFLFSGTFYSLDTYPTWGRIIVECLPLHHAVEIMRDLNAGYLGPGLAGHVTYFLAMAAVGTVITGRRLERLLLS